MAKLIGWSKKKQAAWLAISIAKFVGHVYRCWLLNSHAYLLRWIAFLWLHAVHNKDRIQEKWWKLFQCALICSLFSCLVTLVKCFIQLFQHFSSSFIALFPWKVFKWFLFKIPRKTTVLNEENFVEFNIPEILLGFPIYFEAVSEVQYKKY